MSNQEKSEENFKSLITLFESKDIKVRKKARLSLIAKGKSAVPFLINALQHSETSKVRWESAKALGKMYDVSAIPTLVSALDDEESDVAWLAAEALRKYKKAAWSELLGAIVERGAESIILRRGAYHVIRNQKEDGFNDLLIEFRKALITATAPENVVLLAYKILERTSEQKEPLKKPTKLRKIEKMNQDKNA